MINAILVALTRDGHKLCVFSDLHYFQVKNKVACFFKKKEELYIWICGLSWFVFKLTVQMLWVKYLKIERKTKVSMCVYDTAHDFSFEKAVFLFGGHMTGRVLLLTRWKQRKYMVFWWKYRMKNVLLTKPGASSYRRDVWYMHYNTQVIYLSLKVENANVAKLIYIAFSTKSNNRL